MPSIKDKVMAWLADQFPTVRRTRYDVRQLPTSTLASLDVDRVHDILQDAESGNLGGLMALYRELIMASSHLQGRFVERKEAVLGDALSVQPVDKENADDVAAAAVISDLIENCRDWETGNAHLLDSVLYPVAILEKTYRPSTREVIVSQGKTVRLSYELASLTPVPHDLLTHIAGKTQISQTDERGVATAVYFDPDPGRYIIHRGHLLGTPDNFGGPMRSIVFLALLSLMGRDWWARFLDKYGTPFVVGRYDQADDASRTILMQAFQFATKLGGLVVSKQTEIELKQAAASDSGEAFDAWRTACNEEISKLISGQTLSSDAKATGMGSGVAANQAEVRQDKRASDARRLRACLRYGLFEQYLQFNGIKGRMPKLVFGSDSVDESAGTGTLLLSLSQAGLRPTDEALSNISERVGFAIERAPEAAPTPGGPLTPFSVALRAASRGERATAANDAILRASAGAVAEALGKTYAPIATLIQRSSSPQDAIDRVEAYCASLDPLEASEVMEKALGAMAANGCVVAAK